MGTLPVVACDALEGGVRRVVGIAAAVLLEATAEVGLIVRLALPALPSKVGAEDARIVEAN